jgi:hypothetical protein
LSKRTSDWPAIKEEKQMDEQLREVVEKFLSAQNSSTEKVQESPTESSGSRQDFKDLRILIGVPTHSGLLHHLFVSSLISTTQLFEKHGINYRIEFMSGVVLVTAARNLLANSLFEEEAFTHLLMLDGDQAWNPQDIIKLISADKEVVALPTTHEGFDWDRIAQAAKHGAFPQQLKRFGGVQNFEDISNAQYSTGEPVVEVNRIGSALILIKKTVFEKLQKANPHWRYRRGSGERSTNQEWDYRYFQSEIDPETKHVISEDWFFSRECKKIDISIFMIPGSVTRKIGPTVFFWDASSIAELNMLVAGKH